MAAHVVLFSGMKMPDSNKTSISIRRLNEPRGEWAPFETVAGAAESIGVTPARLFHVLAGRQRQTGGWIARREFKPTYGIADGCKKCEHCPYVFEKKFFWSDRRKKEIGKCAICTQQHDDNMKKDPIYAAIEALWTEYKRRACVDCGETSNFIEADHVYGPSKWILVEQKEKKKAVVKRTAKKNDVAKSTAKKKEKKSCLDECMAAKTKMKKIKICLSNIHWWAHNGGVAAWKREAALTLPRRKDYHRIRTRRWYNLKKELLAAVERRRSGQPIKATSVATERILDGPKTYAERCVRGKAYIDARKRKVGMCECGKEECKRRVQSGMEYLFEWDHLHRSTKTADISAMTDKEIREIDEELKNCRLLYCLCHTVHTRQQNAERVAKRLETIAEMEQVKAVASTVDTLATLTGPLAAPPAAPAAPASASAVQSPTYRAPKRRRL